MLWSELWTPLPLLQNLVLGDATQQGIELPTFAFGEKWEILGPWQIGTRGM